MRPGGQQHFFYNPAPPAQQNSFGPIPQHSPFLSPLYSAVPPQVHTTAHGVPVLGVPVGAVNPQFQVGMPGLPPQNGGAMGVPPPWGHIRSETQSWGTGVFQNQPSQGVPNAAFSHGRLAPFDGFSPITLASQTSQVSVQPFPQQFHQPHQNLQFFPSVVGPGNGVPMNNFGGDGPLGKQQWGPSHAGNGVNGYEGSVQFHSQPMQQNSLEGNAHLGNAPEGNGHFRGQNPRDGEGSYHANFGGSRYAGGRSNSRSIGGRHAKGRGADAVRSQAFSLRCDPCERTFNISQQHAAHISTHVKCDVAGCSFEASGRVVKEHKQSVHDVSLSMSTRPVNPKQRENEDEIQKWRDERKRNYPTSGNIERKADEINSRKARGELIDEDAKKRKERLKEILAKQAELGCPVAEVPAYYMSDQYCSLAQGNGKGQDRSKRNKRNFGRGKGGKDRSKGYDQGRLNKRRRNDHSSLPDESVAEEKGKNLHSGQKRAPSLLSKLLDPQIRRDKSHLLQCFRFFVNNNFLLKWPEVELKFFEWTEPVEINADHRKVSQETNADQEKVSEEINVYQEKLSEEINAGEEIHAYQKVVAEEIDADQEKVAEEMDVDQEKLAEEINADQEKVAEEINADQEKVAEEINADQEKVAEEIDADQEKVAEEIDADQEKVAVEIDTDQEKVAEEIDADQEKVAEEIYADQVKVAEEIIADQENAEESNIY